MLKYFTNYPISILVGCIILYLSLFTPPKNDLETIPNIDKLVHICMYGGLCTIIWIEFLRRHHTIPRIKILIFAIFLPILMGGIIEIMQSILTDNRSGDWWDLVADAIGVVTASILGYYVIRPLMNRLKR